MEIELRSAVLHILDSNVAYPVFSQQELDLSDDVINQFILTHAKKIFQDKSAKTAIFRADSEFQTFLSESESDFINGTTKMAKKLFEIMKRFVDIPRADFLAAIIELDNKLFLLLIKFNYKVGYTHLVDYEGSGTTNKIIQHQVIFASESQKIDEGALVQFDDSSVILLEKPYFVDGEKVNYFSEIFLQCDTELSRKESIKVVTNVADEINQKYYGDSFEKTALVKTAIYESLEKEGSIHIETVAEMTYPDNAALKQQYIEKVKSSGVSDEIHFSEENPQKSFKKQKIKIENGIELNIPMEIYNNRDIIEFINNSDGTISIVIKNVGKIVSK